MEYEAFAAGDGAASDTEDGEAGVSGGRSSHFADIQEAAQVLGLNYKDNNRRRVVQLAGEPSGPDSGPGSKRMLKSTQSELLAAASEAASDATGLRPSGMQSDWRAAVRSKSHSMLAPPPGLQLSSAGSPTAPGEMPVGPKGPPVPPVAPQLAQLEAAVEAVASLKEEQLQTFITAVQVAAKAASAAEAAAAAATAGAPPEEQAAAVKAAGAAASRVLMYDEAAMSVEKLLAESAERLQQARAIYEQAHAAKLSAIAGQSELQRELQLLREWLAGAEQQRLALAAAALAAQRQRLEAAAGSASSPALSTLLEQCSGAAESLGALASGIETATAEAEAQLAERQRRREALRLIEDECVKLATDMEQREETDRLAALMKAEAEAERAMAEAKVGLRPGSRTGCGMGGEARWAGPSARIPVWVGTGAASSWGPVHGLKMGMQAPHIMLSRLLTLYAVAHPPRTPTCRTRRRPRRTRSWPHSSWARRSGCWSTRYGAGAGAGEHDQRVLTVHVTWVQQNAVQRSCVSRRGVSCTPGASGAAVCCCCCYLPQVRAAALRAAERDEQRMAVLLAAEREKATKAGAGFDSSLLDELKEVRSWMRGGSVTVDVRKGL